MAKRLTVSELQRQDLKEYGVKREVMIDDIPVLIDKKFRDSKVRELLVELVRNVDYMRRLGASIEGLDISSYVSILMIKYFTDVEVPDKVEDQLVVLNMLIDLGYFKPIMNAFDTEQMEKVNNAMDEILDNLDAKLEILKDQNDKFEAIFEVKKDELDGKGE